MDNSILSSSVTAVHTSLLPVNVEVFPQVLSDFTWKKPGGVTQSQVKLQEKRLSLTETRTARG